MPLLAVVVVLIGLLGTVDLLLTVTGARGVRGYGDLPAEAGQMQPAGPTLRPVAVFGGQSAEGDVIDSAA